MLPDEIPDWLIEIECGSDRDRRANDPNRPTRNSFAIHNKFSVIAVIPSGVEAATQRTESTVPGFQSRGVTPR